MNNHNVSKIGSKDTKPEIVVRKILHSLGLRYRLHSKKIFGRPDIVLRKHNTVLFIHGCFWHRHVCRNGTSVPKTNTDFWLNKFGNNVKRDKLVIDRLKEEGWRVLVYWECETKNLDQLRVRVSRDFPDRLLPPNRKEYLDCYSRCSP